VNGFANDVDSGNISLVLNSDSSGFICVTRNSNTVKMSEKNGKAGIPLKVSIGEFDRKMRLIEKLGFYPQIDLKGWL